MRDTAFRRAGTALVRHSDAMAWDRERISELAAAYRLHHVARQGDRDARARATEYWWAWECVHEGVLDGSLPIEVLDALVHHPEADAEFRAAVAAGPVEDALCDHITIYGGPIAARCASDMAWTEVVSGVWVDEREWQALPELLQRLIPVHAAAQPKNPAKVKRAKRPSKRQGKQPNHP